MIRPGVLVRVGNVLGGIVLMKDKPKRNDVWNEADMVGEFQRGELGFVITSDTSWALVLGSKGIGWCKSSQLIQVLT